VGLIAHYEFENNANDSSGNVNHGTEIGGITYADGLLGQAASFNGADSYIEVPDSSSLEFTNTITVNAWVNVSADTDRYLANVHYEKRGTRTAFKRSPIITNYCYLSV
jgi:hypothetical protein